jgi:hypothetical protein
MYVEQKLSRVLILYEMAALGLAGTFPSKKNCRNYFTCTPDGLVSAPVVASLYLLTKAFIC